MSADHIFMCDAQGYVFSVLLASGPLAVAYSRELLPVSTEDRDKLEAYERTRDDPA